MTQRELMEEARAAARQYAEGDREMLAEFLADFSAKVRDEAIKFLDGGCTKCGAMHSDWHNAVTRAEAAESKLAGSQSALSMAMGELTETRAKLAEAEKQEVSYHDTIHRLESRLASAERVVRSVAINGACDISCEEGKCFHYDMMDAAKKHLAAYDAQTGEGK